MDFKLVLVTIILFHHLNALPQEEKDKTINNDGSTTSDTEDPPEGYYAFIESPSAVPPKVRPPPYTHVNIECQDQNSKKTFVSVHNICGDLNKGHIPRNPMRQNIMGEPYPFELIRNQTLKFLSKTLPVLKADDTLPKVAQISQEEILDTFESNNGLDRQGRAAEHPPTQSKRKNEEPPRESRKFCDGGGVFCSLYHAINSNEGGGGGSGKYETSPQQSHHVVAERREEIGPASGPRYDGPPTPCPAKVEYATPVFAKNYQGSWRYVVQIPYEGYFTQTVEVTRCLQARCHYLDGGCLSSPRWVSMLVAEIFYPNSNDYQQQQQQTTTSTTTPAAAPHVQDFQAYQQYLQKRAGVATASDGTSSGGGAGSGGSASLDELKTDIKLPHCDGHDEIGCFQVRLYYDWFLIPGSCKCWRPDYFARYVRRKPGASTTEL